MRWKNVALALLILLTNTNVSMARDDFQYWSQFLIKPYKGEKTEVMILTDSRFMRDAEKLGLYFISPRLVYHYSENLDFGLNYTYLQSRNTSSAATDDSYNRQHRAEIEVNPNWFPTDWLKVKMRNRVEFRWIEGQGSDNTRYRQRWMFDVPFKDQLPLKSIYASSEFFYDFAKNEYNENRSIPIGLNFKINKKLGGSLYYMVQSRKGTNDWSSNQILGTLISIDF